MTDHNEAVGTETDEAREPEPKQPSGSFTVAMFGDAKTLIWPGCTNGAYYIKAERAGTKGEDKISNAGMHIKGHTVKGTRNQVVIDSTMNPASVYVEKCVQQITDFRFPALVKKKVDGVEQVVEEIKTYNASSGGDNPANRECYEYMADRRIRIPVSLLTHEELDYIGDDEDRTEICLVELLDGFLDFVHGRDSEAAKDFEALGNGLMA